MNATELRSYIESKLPQQAAKVNGRTDAARLKLALNMIDALHQLVNPDWNNSDQIIASRVIMDTLKQHGYDYTTILSAKGGLELLIERGASA